MNLDENELIQKFVYLYQFAAPFEKSQIGFAVSNLQNAYDEHNAYYILTPQRIEKIMHFADVMNGQVSFVFRDEKLFVAVRRDSMFDASMDEPVSKQTKNIIEDAEFIQMAKEILIAS